MLSVLDNMSVVPRASVEYTGSWSSSKSVFSGKVLIRYWPSLDVGGEGWGCCVGVEVACVG